MTMIYFAVGFAVTWALIVSLILLAGLVLFEYLCAVYRAWRTVRRIWSEGATAWPRLDKRWKKVRAFFRDSYWLMTGRYQAVTDAGNEIPRYPWQRMPK